MIGMLTGTVAFAAEDHVVIDVGGVGYVVHCATPTLSALTLGEGAMLYTDLLVREDLLQLFGFRSPAEREWHRLLTRVQGVGAKVSLAILGTAGAEGVSRAIALSDPTALRAAAGVGPKLAQRIVNELKDKAPAVMAVGAGAGQPVPAQSAPPSATVDAVSALVNLGYAAGEAQAAAMRAADDGADSVQEIIRAALRLLAPQG